MEWLFRLSIGYPTATRTLKVDLGYLGETEESWALLTETEKDELLTESLEEWAAEYIDSGYEEV
jgi:hypothetical protein